MSMFQTMTVGCPVCGKGVAFKAAFSVNADRRADLREAIIDGSFQLQACPKCGKSFRLDPELTYVDVGRGQWIAAFPVAKLGQWRTLEEQARLTFAQAYGPAASAGAQEMGAAMKPRITFGWGALREKLVVAEHQLDDVTIELVKLAIVRTSEKLPLSNDTELRFGDIEEDKLVLAWMHAQTENAVEVLKVSRQLYDDIAANGVGWKALREELSRGLFVDMNRLMVVAA
jgi:endogenous inhibitor of DNA gyrase (YacG/DUF329 family)